MIDKMMHFDQSKWAALFFVSFVDFLVIYLAGYFFIQAKKGFGFNVKVYKNGRWGEFTEPKKASKSEKRNIWIIIYILLAFFLFYGYMISRDSKLWS